MKPRENNHATTSAIATTTSFINTKQPCLFRGINKAVFIGINSFFTYCTTSLPDCCKLCFA